MGLSAINVLQEIILETVRLTAQGEWKVFILDDRSKKLVDSVVKEDDILKENVIILHPELRSRIDRSAMAREQIALFRILNINFFPRESHLITFRDPWSFPVLYHPACNQLVREHMDDLAQKIVSVCVSLGEYPTIRYYRPQNASHEASVLCSHLARFVQDELDQYTKYHDDFPPASPRPRGALIITDRSMDLFAPFLHEFTYQAMIHDLLPIEEADKTSYKTIVNQGEANEEEKNMEIGEQDGIWVENRHLHMKDLLEKLVSDFNKFRADNPQFAESGDNANSLNNIKDMLAGLPQFQKGKEAYSLHLNMAQEAMNLFQKCRLPDIASVEQSLATGFDEDYKRPKNLADQVVRLLDDDNVTFPDRLRLIIEYMLYREGLFPSDIQKLLAHARLPSQDGEVIQNLELLGARVHKPMKDTRPINQSLFSRKPPPPQGPEDSSLSRYNPAVKFMLEEHIQGTLDQSIFPFTKPHLDAAEGLTGQENVSQASLRSAKPTWARTRPSAMEPRQRIIVFMAGGATYSESRVCYETSRSFSKDVFLTTSHMLTPSLFLRQVGDLSVDKRRLDLPADRPKPKAPAHLFEREPQPSALTTQPPTAAMSTMNINPNGPSNSPQPNGSVQSHVLASPPTNVPTSSTGKLAKKEKEKKRHHFFSSKK
ncbi:vacuolar sorting protein VPS33/slp1 [Lignoscripta atroalba]|nr:vacuolar sorting protein VPS33/slp1 [Lignoscripta atroalba]